MMPGSSTQSKLELILENQAKILSILETQHQGIDKMDRHVDFVHRHTPPVVDSLRQDATKTHTIVFSCADVSS